MNALEPMNVSKWKLPLEDEYTTYDYNIGKDRMYAVGYGQYKITYLDEVTQGMGFQSILQNPFNEQLRGLMYSGQLRAPKFLPKLKVTYHKNGLEVRDKMNAISLEKTIEFTDKAIKRWGGDAETVLSATKTGSLYWNVIHHFGSFEKFPSNKMS